jgi:hypothetical protein
MSFKNRISIITTTFVFACPMIFGQVYTPPSAGYKANKALIGAGIGAGVGAAVLYMTLHHRGMYTGCIGADGKSLVRNDGKTFQLSGLDFKPGEKLSLKATKDKEDSSGSKLNVVDVKKDFGPCEK